MRIITISREFGSGGRELGKRLADALGVSCYDQQIIDMIAQKKNLDKNYIAHVSEKDVRVLYSMTANVVLAAIITLVCTLLTEPLSKFLGADAFYLPMVKEYVF